MQKQFCKEIKEAYRNVSLYYMICSRVRNCYIIFVSFYTCHFYPQLRQGAGLPVLASDEQESPFSVSRRLQPSRQLSKSAARRTRPSQPMTGRVINRELLDSTLTAANYKDKFLLLNELEMQEHEHVLERYALVVLVAASLILIPERAPTFIWGTLQLPANNTICVVLQGKDGTVSVHDKGKSYLLPFC